jgi:hypothetical protein
MAQEPKPDKKDDRLDGSVTGTIGGGGPHTGGPTERPAPPDMPPVKPENAASGRLEPDPLAATVERNDIKPGPTDVSRR